MARILSTGEAKRFYDRFGRLQDGQVLYEGRALETLERNGRFEHVARVIEFGCGTGAFARRLLRRRLPSEAWYLGLDVSETMVRIARERLKPWAERAEVLQTSGEVRIPAEDHSADRIVVNYVLDLLNEDDIRALIVEAGRALQPGGLLCIASLTHGATAPARVIARLWACVQAINPAWTGGCRPIRIEDYLEPASWRVERQEVVTQCAVSSEVLVASPR